MSAVDSFAERLTRWCIGWRWFVLMASVAACLGIGYGASALRFAGDYRVFFGPENPDFLANERAQATFGRPDNVAFLLVPKSGTIFETDTLQAVHTLTDRAWSLPYASRVDSLTNFQATRGDGENLIVEDLVLDPSALDAAALDGVRRIALSEPLLKDFIADQQGRATIVNVVVQLPSDVPNIASTVKNEARALRDELQAAHPNLEIHIAGVAALSAAFEEAGLRDSSTLLPAVYLFILVVMYVVFRSAYAVLVTFGVILLSTVIGMGAGGWAGVELTPISISAPIIILTVGVADAIHVLSAVRARMRFGAAREEAIVYAVRNNFGAIILTSVTTVIGFLTLNFSDSPPFHHLGNMTAAGVTAALILSLTFLPAALSFSWLRFPAQKAESSRSLTGAISAVAGFVIRSPRKALVGTGAACLALIAFIPTMETNDQWSQYFDESLEFRQAIDRANPFFGTDAVEFVFDSGAQGGVTDPEFLETVDAFTGWLRTNDATVAHAYSFSDVMKRVNFNMNGDDSAFATVPDDAALAAQYLLVYELSLPQGLDLTDRVDIDKRLTRVTATMRDLSTKDTKAFLESARQWLAENGNRYAVDTTGSKVLFSYVADRNITSMYQGSAYLALAIFLVLAIAFRSLSIGFFSLAANALPILATFGAWALLVGIVGFSVAAVGAVAIGLVVDYAVHFISKYQTARTALRLDVALSIQHAFNTAGVAIAATTVILAAGFAVLATSSFKLNADLGLMTAIAIVFAMAVNFLMLPAAFRLLDRDAPAST